jgi:hypothetical protein
MTRRNCPLITIILIAILAWANALAIVWKGPN